MDTTSRLRSVGGAYVAGSLGAVAAYPFLPASARILCFLMVSGASVPLVYLGLRRVAAGDRRPWWFLLAGLGVLHLGHIARLGDLAPGAVPTRAGTAWEMLGTIGNALVLAAVLEMIARRVGDGTGGLLEAAAVSMVAGGLLGGSATLPGLMAAEYPSMGQMVTLVVVFAVSGVLGAPGRRLPNAQEWARTCSLFGAAFAILLLGYGVKVLWSQPLVGVVAAMLLMAAHTALGLMGLELFATGPARPRPVPRDVLTTDRLRLLGIVLTVVLVADGGFELFSLDVNGALLSAGGAAVAALMTVRLRRVAARHASLMGTLAHEATHDPLTGLPNRKEFLARLTAELHRPHGCLVLFCDLDGFKAANDRYGHAAGDLLLVEVALRLRQSLRSNDTVARFGGDEFVILYREAAQHDQAVLCARLRAAVARPIQLGADPVVLGVSIGGAYSAGAVEGAEATADELIRTADEAMYANKQCRARAAGAAPRTGRPFERSVHRYLVTDGDGGSPPERARPSRVSAAAHPTDAGWSLAS